MAIADWITSCLFIKIQKDLPEKNPKIIQSTVVTHKRDYGSQSIFTKSSNAILMIM